MPIASHSNQSAGGYEQPQSQAGVMQIDQPEMPNPIPASIAASGTWLSGIIYSNGYKALSVGITASGASGGFLKIHRYIDRAGLVEQTVSSTAIVGGTALIVNLTDNVPFITYQIEIANGAAISAISSFAVLMSAV